MVAQILDRSEVDNVVIFLDGHFSGNNTAQGSQPEPALDEIEQLAPYRHKIAAIVIDDFRTFGTQEGVPPKSALLKTLESCFPDYELVVHLDQCIATRNRVESPFLGRQRAAS